MKFRYKKYAPEILRPIIPIEIIYRNLFVPYEALVDSGADFCIFDREMRRFGEGSYPAAWKEGNQINK